MTKSKLSFKKNITDKLLVQGILSDDGTYITYTDENLDLMILDTE